MLDKIDRINRFLERHDEAGDIEAVCRAGDGRMSVPSLTEAVLEETEGRDDPVLVAYGCLLADERSLQTSSSTVARDGLERMLEEQGLSHPVVSELRSSWVAGHDGERQYHHQDPADTLELRACELLALALEDPDSRWRPGDLIEVVKRVLPHQRSVRDVPVLSATTAAERLLEHPDADQWDRQQLARYTDDDGVRALLVEEGEVLDTRQGRHLLLGGSTTPEVMAAVTRAAPDWSAEEQKRWVALLTHHPDEAVALVEEGVVAILEETVRPYRDADDQEVREAARWVLGYA